MRCDKAISIHTGGVPDPYFQSLKTRDFAICAIFQLVLLKLRAGSKAESTSRSQRVFPNIRPAYQHLLACTSLKASITANIHTGGASGSLQYNISEGKTYLLIPAQVISL